MDFHDNFYMQQFEDEIPTILASLEQAPPLHSPHATNRLFTLQSSLGQLETLVREILKIRIRLTIEFVHTYPEGAQQ